MKLQLKQLQEYNNDYKILSKVLCLRLAPNMHHVLDGTQTGVPGQTISDPIHTTQSIIYDANKYKLWLKRARNVSKESYLKRMKTFEFCKEIRNGAKFVSD